MNKPVISGTRIRLHSWLTIGYMLFIVYGSLSPFSGWRAHGLDFSEVLRAHVLKTYTAFDAVINLLSYLPFGLLVCLTLRIRFGPMAGVILTLCLGVLLSASMEYLQMYLPRRTSSNMDLLTNGVGTLAGALLAVTLAARTSLLERLTRWRNDLFHHGKEMDFGLALLALWMFGQVNPVLPMLGNVFISEAARQPFVAPPQTPFDWWESGAVTLNLLMLGVLLLTLLRASRYLISVLMLVLSIVALAKFTTATLLLKSWALLLWINSEAMIGMLLGLLLLFPFSGTTRARASGFGAAVALTYVAIANFVLDNSTPSAATSIYHWHYGHLLNYNGLAQTIALIFPVLLLFYLWRIGKIKLGSE